MNRIEPHVNLVALRMNAHAQCSSHIELCRKFVEPRIALAQTCACLAQQNEHAAR